MIVDASDYDGAEEIPSDICIAGAGAAGITLALQFLGRKERVVVLEGGSDVYSEESQDIYRGEIVGHDYYPLDVARLRYFGGTTNHWNGQCRPLDPLDFVARPWVPHSGWPIGPKDLQPYRDQAHEILDLGPPAYSPKDLVPQDHLLPLDPDRLVHCIWRFSPPTRLGEKYQQTLAEAPNVTVLLNASVTDIILADGLRAVAALEVTVPNGRRLRARAARGFVLALGGLENPRGMLNADKQLSGGIGNENDLVGRFFMEHPEGVTGGIALNETGPWMDAGYTDKNGQELMIGVAVSATAQERERILNHSVVFKPGRQRDPSPGFVALHTLARNMSGGDFADFGDHIMEVMKDLGGTARGLYYYATGHGAAVFTRAEQAPNPESRVKLVHEVDALGLRRIALDWRLTSLDLDTMRVANRLLGRELGRLGWGRLGLPEWLQSNDSALIDAPLRGGYHHIGTTRMADDPKQGVVDRHCRVHGTENLYVAGSSVFPTGGFANPTLTIVMLTLRLADHLKATA